MNELIATFHIEWAQFFAQLINFVIAMTILWFLIGRTLVKSLDSRREIIKKGVEQGIESDTILEQSKIEAQKIISTAEEGALHIVADASHTASNTIAQAEHNAFLIERSLIEKAHANAADVFSHELTVKKQELAEQIVSVTQDIISNNLTNKQQHTQYVAAKLGQ